MPRDSCFRSLFSTSQRLTGSSLVPIGRTRSVLRSKEAVGGCRMTSLQFDTILHRFGRLAVVLRRFAVILHRAVGPGLIFVVRAINRQVPVVDLEREDRERSQIEATGGSSPEIGNGLERVPAS